MSNRDDDLPEVETQGAHDRNDFRGRENETDDEGMPSVNRRKRASKTTSIAMLVMALAAGLSLIYAVNFGGKKKPDEVVEVKASTSSLPPIDFTPPPPPRPPAPSAAQAAPPGQQANNGQPQQPTRGPNGKAVLHWSDRKLIGDVIVTNKGQSSASNVQGGRIPDYPQQEEQGGAMPGGRDGLAGRLQATPLHAVSASVLTNRNFLITKGTPLDCALETAIDTTLPGIIVCRMTRDVYSANGQVLLLERGTKMVGEQQGNVKQGQARVFALWTRAETPNGVIINLDSPGTDALGRSGLEGWVDNHFAERFGAAILMSFIQSSLDYLVAQQQNNAGSTILSDTSGEGESVVGKILDNTINIPPTIIKNQGDHISIMVARDLDFSTVYELQVHR